jgi:hypothetical protein
MWKSYLFVALACLALAVSATRPTCPTQGAFSTANVNNVHLTLMVDDAFPQDPINGNNTAGFSDYLGLNNAETLALFTKGVAYIKWRFGIDASACPPSSIYTSCTLKADPANPTTGWKLAGPNDVGTVVITPVSYSAGNTYRVVNSNSLLILPVPALEIYPTVRLAQWIMTFLGSVNISGDAGLEASPATGYYTLNLDAGQAVGDGVAWGRYVLCSGGHNYSFDMRSWVVSRRWATFGNAQSFYYTEKFQLGSVPPNPIPSGHGTLEIVYPAGAEVVNGVTAYPWYVGALWNLGPLNSHPSYNHWNVACGTACDTTTVRGSY